MAEFYLDDKNTEAVFNAVLKHLIATVGGRINVQIPNKIPSSTFSTTIHDSKDGTLSVELILVERKAPR